MAVMGLRLAGRSNGVSKLHGDGEPRDVRRPLARRPARRGADHVGHQRRARPHVGVARDGRPARRATCCPSGPRPAPERWARIDEAARRRGVAGRASRAASGSSRSSGGGCASRRSPAALSTSDVGVGRRGARPRGPHDRLRPAVRHLQAGHPAAVAARAAQGAAARPATGRCSSCSPARPTRPTTRGKEMIRQIVAVRRRPRRPPPLRVPRGLRHRRRPHAVPGRRRVAEQPAAAAGGVRHVGHEGGAQRRAQLLDPRRLVGRAVRRRERLGDLVGRARSTTSSGATRSRRTRCSSCSSARSCRCSTSGAEGPVPRRWVRPDQARRSRSLGPEVHRRPDGARLRRGALRADRRRSRAGCRATASHPARELAAWKARVLRGVARRARRSRSRPTPSVGRASARERAGRRGRSRSARSTPTDVEVQLLHGPVGQSDELVDPTVGRRMTAAGADDDGHPPVPRQLHLRAAPAATASRCGSCPPTPTS